jgi:hypothetical protein
VTAASEPDIAPANNHAAANVAIIGATLTLLSPGWAGTNVTFALSNSTAGAFSVLMSTNLADWDYLGPATPRYEFTDTNTPAIPQRYYRLRWP